MSEGGSVDGQSVAQMAQVIHKRGVKKRFEDDFALKCGDGEDGPVDETENQFLHRVILTLRKADVKDIVKALDRVEKRNRQAVAKDAAWTTKQQQARAKVARDEAAEVEEDEEFGTWHVGTPEEFAAEIEDCWAKLLPGEKDFSAFAGARVSGGAEQQPRGQDTLAGSDLSKVHEALRYFHTKLSTTTAGANEFLCGSDASSVQAELAFWSPAQVVSAYRKLSLTAHPDKEGGSPEAFQELTSHSKVLMEACGWRPSVRRGSRRKPVAPARRSCVAKPAICAEMPEAARAAMVFFGLAEEDFRGGAAEMKRLRSRLGTLKAQKEKDIQREREPERLLELLRAAEGREEASSPAAKDVKQIKDSCTDVCRRNYTALYTYIQRLK